MLKTIRAALLGASCLMPFVAASAYAGETKHWTTTSSGWSVDLHDTGNCTAQRRTSSGVKLLFGWEPKQGGVWIGFGHADWKPQVTEDKTYNVTMVTDGKSWKPTIYYGHLTDTDGTFISGNSFSKEFAAALAKSNRIEFWWGQTWLTKLSLDGSYEALMEMFDCQTLAGRTSSNNVTPQGNSEVKQWSVPIERSGINIRLEGKLNDKEALTFMLDTGATAVSIPRVVADRLGLKIVRLIDVEYADGRKGKEPMVVIPKLSVGGVVFLRDVEATLSDGEPLLGKNFLDAFSSYQIDNRQAKLVLNK